MPRRQEPLLSIETLRWLQTACGNRAVGNLLKRRALQRARDRRMLAVRLEAPELQISAASTRHATLNHSTWWLRILRWLHSRWTHWRQHRRNFRQGNGA
jgi:hypothetical protein